MNEYKKVDVIQYVKKGIEDGTLSFAEAKKFQRIMARQGTVGEEIETILKDGTQETEKRVVKLDEKTNQPGWVVRNINSPEEWIVEDGIFSKKYEIDPENPEVYKPKGGPMLAVQIKEDLEITPPNWGGDIQKINAGGYLLMDPENSNDIYGIGEEEFLITYKFVEQEQEETKIR